MLPPAVVVDASVAVKWVLPEQDSDVAALLRLCALHAPPMFPTEVANVIWRNVAQKRIPADRAVALAALVESIGVIVHPPPSLPAVVAAAVDLNHPAYDCEYLLLAEALDAPLVSADERLIRVARGSQRFAARVLPLSDLA